MAGFAATSSLASLQAEETQAIAAATLVDPSIAQYDNMSTIQFDALAYSLNYTQTGCYRPGALPVALASNDTCLSGWYCK
jgi:hypothetical protein